MSSASSGPAQKESPESAQILASYSNLHCACGQPFGTDKSAETHITTCVQFKARFGELFAALANAAKNIKNRNDYNLIKYIFHLQKNNIRQRIKCNFAFINFCNSERRHTSCAGVQSESFAEIASRALWRTRYARGRNQTKHNDCSERH